jgi:hypothetical protein
MPKIRLGKRLEKIFMNEFLLLTVVIVYVAISYRSTSTEAHSDQQDHHKERGSYKPRGTRDS